MPNKDLTPARGQVQRLVRAAVEYLTSAMLAYGGFLAAQSHRGITALLMFTLAFIKWWDVDEPRP